MKSDMFDQLHFDFIKSQLPLITVMHQKIGRVFAIVSLSLATTGPAGVISFVGKIGSVAVTLEVFSFPFWPKTQKRVFYK